MRSRREGAASNEVEGSRSAALRSAPTVAIIVHEPRVAIEECAIVALACSPSLLSLVMGRGPCPRWIVVAIALALPAVAAAQDAGVDGGIPWTPECPLDGVGCDSSDVDFHHRDALFDTFMLDSGWVPAGSPLQVRFGVHLGGSTELDLGGTAVTSWPPALDVAVPGRPGTGRLAIDYGLEITARIRIDVEVGGVRYTWEGDIPLPGGIPRDLRVAAESTFDPFVLPPSEPRPVTAWDDTDMVTVLNVDLTDALIPIPGIGGGFLVDAVGSLEGDYQTDRIEISDAVTDITLENEAVIVRADPGATELGGSKDFTVLPHGTIRYDGDITLYPRLYIEIAGRRFDLTLAEVPLNVVDLTSETAFEPASVHVPLPDVRIEPTALDLGEVPIGGAGERLVTIHNDGEAALWVRFEEPAAPFSVLTTSLTVPPSSSARLLVRFAPTSPGDASAVLSLATNDPDEPRVVLRLTGVGTGEADASLPDAGVVDGGGGLTMAGGCGCRAAPASDPSPLALLAVGLLLAARRRRAARTTTSYRRPASRASRRCHASPKARIELAGAGTSAGARGGRDDLTPRRETRTEECPSPRRSTGLSQESLPTASRMRATPASMFSIEVA